MKFYIFLLFFCSLSPAFAGYEGDLSLETALQVGKQALDFDDPIEIKEVPLIVPDSLPTKHSPLAACTFDNDRTIVLINRELLIEHLKLTHQEHLNYLVGHEIVHAIEYRKPLSASAACIYQRLAAICDNCSSVLSKLAAAIISFKIMCILVPKYFDTPQWFKENFFIKMGRFLLNMSVFSVFGLGGTFAWATYKSRAEEFKADEVALRRLSKFKNKKKIHPGIDSSLRKYAVEIYRTHTDEELDESSFIKYMFGKFKSFFSTHPSIQARIERIQNL